MPGHDLGHSNQLPPVGLDWSDYVRLWVDDRGSWSGLADELISRARDSPGIATDMQTVERGLRRLSKRGYAPGGQYGRLMLRFFGFPSDVKDWTKWMGQYHTRFADLPCSLRLSQLRLWNRGPIEESPQSTWIELGLASVHHRMKDLDACEQWLSIAERQMMRAPLGAEIEARLFRARLNTDAGDRVAAREHFDRVDELIGSSQLCRADNLAYRARLAGQRAYHLTRAASGEEPDLESAARLFREIEEDEALPFVSFRKLSGLAYCTWQLGSAEKGAELIRRAVDFAGDGGLVRFRVMALNMLSRMVEPVEAKRIRGRALQMATQLEDEDLVYRVGRHASESSTS